MTRLMRAAFVLTLLGGTLAVTAAPASAYTASCFYDMVTNGTREARADWDRDGHTDQCFAIKPDRTIWNVWRGASGWVQMPNNGRADAVCRAGYDTATGYHTVYVYVNNVGQYSSSYNPNTHKWQAWTYLGTHC
jgi:hypothetical protein